MRVGGGVRVQVVMRSAAHVYTRLSASPAWRLPHVAHGPRSASSVARCWLHSTDGAWCLPHAAQRAVRRRGMGHVRWRDLVRRGGNGSACHGNMMVLAARFT